MNKAQCRAERVLWQRRLDRSAAKQEEISDLIRPVQRELDRLHTRLGKEMERYREILDGTPAGFHTTRCDRCRKELHGICKHCGWRCWCYQTEGEKRRKGNA